MLSNVPFADGQHVRVTVAEVADVRVERIPIAEVRNQLRGSMQLGEPDEPMIPQSDWEMLK